jgi:tetratricopeptide (TPR) repeat protein
MLLRRYLASTALAFSLALATGVALSGEPQVSVPQPARDRYDEAQALEKQGKIKEALAAYQQAINLGMQLFPRAHLKEAKAFLDLKDYDTAVARFSKFIDNFGLEDSCRY